MLAACGESTAPVSVVGAWNLETIDGTALPVTLLHASGVACGVAVTGGRFVFESGGKFSGSETYGQTVNGVLYCSAQSVLNGTYTSDGGTVTTTNTAGGGKGHLTLSGSALTKTFEGHSFVYRK